MYFTVELPWAVEIGNFSPQNNLRRIPGKRAFHDGDHSSSNDLNIAFGSVIYERPVSVRGAHTRSRRSNVRGASMQMQKEVMLASIIIPFPPGKACTEYSSS